MLSIEEHVARVTEPMITSSAAGNEGTHSR